MSHPSAAVIAAYTTGELPLAPSLVVAAHLEACAQCRLDVGEIEFAEGQLLQSLPDAELSPDLLERTLARLEDADVEHEFPLDGRLGDTVLPEAVARLGLRARRFLGPQLWVAPVKLPPRSGWRVYILRAPPGMRIPRHRHRGQEFVQVLAGAFQDGRRYSQGDFAENPADEEHELRVTAAGPCASLIASQGGSRWPGLLGAAAPLLGI